jgi:hypothetical protein
VGFRAISKGKHNTAHLERELELQEFVHAATDPCRFKVPLTMDQALERSRFWWESAEVVQFHPGGRAWEQAWAWMEKFRLGRKRILDSYLADTSNKLVINWLTT